MDNFITNSWSISSLLVAMYQEDIDLYHYWQFCLKLPLQNTENGQSLLRFPPIRKVDLLGWPLNSESGKPLLFSNIPNDVSEWCRTDVAHGAVFAKVFRSLPDIRSGKQIFFTSPNKNLPDRIKRADLVKNKKQKQKNCFIIIFTVLY